MHFGDQVWIDFVRGLLAPDEDEAIRVHLASGCAWCQEAHGLWGKVWIAASREDRYEALKAAVRAGKAAFILRRSTPLLAQLAEAARMIFDSFTEPLPAGIRGAASGPRYLLHQRDSILVDFRLEEDAANQYSLTGQVLDSQQDDATAHTGVVLVNNAGEFVAQTIANSFGEFQLEFESQSKLKLHLALPAGKVLAVCLPDLPDPTEAKG